MVQYSGAGRKAVSNVNQMNSSAVYRLREVCSGVGAVFAMYISSFVCFCHF